MDSAVMFYVIGLIPYLLIYYCNAVDHILQMGFSFSQFLFVVVHSFSCRLQGTAFSI